MVAEWQKRLAPSTVYYYRRALKKLVSQIAVTANRPELVLEIPKVRRHNPRTTIAAPGEIEQAISTAPGWMRLCILIAAHAGLRRSDILRLAEIHHNPETRTIRIEQHKTGKLLEIPVTETLSVAIAQLPPEANPFIPFVERAAGKKVTVHMFNHEWDAVRRRAKINRKLTMHDLRRTLAVSLYEVSKHARPQIHRQHGKLPGAPGPRTAQASAGPTLDTERTGSMSDAEAMVRRLLNAGSHPMKLPAARKLAGFIIHARPLTDEERKAIKTLLAATSPEKQTKKGHRRRLEPRNSSPKGCQDRG